MMAEGGNPHIVLQHPQTTSAPKCVDDGSGEHFHIVLQQPLPEDKATRQVAPIIWECTALWPALQRSHGMTQAAETPHPNWTVSSRLGRGGSCASKEQIDVLVWVNACDGPCLKSRHKPEIACSASRRDASLSLTGALHVSAETCHS